MTADDALRQEWRARAERDRRLMQQLPEAKAALERFDANGDLARALSLTGLGNHPSVIEALVRVAKADPDTRLRGELSEDGVAQRLFGSANATPPPPPPDLHEEAMRRFFSGTKWEK